MLQFIGCPQLGQMEKHFPSQVKVGPSCSATPAARSPRASDFVLISGEQDRRSRSSMALSSTLFLDGVGDVGLTLSPDALSWKPINRVSDASLCLGKKFYSKAEVEIKFSDVYAVEFFDWGPIHGFFCNAGGLFYSKNPEMYRFVVHGFHRSRISHLDWVPSAYTFGHTDLLTCQTWVEQIEACLNMEVGRPKSILVFVHPLCGKRNGRKTWDIVAPIFSRAKVKTKVIVTQRAGHAFDMITSSTDRELSCFDGIVAVGGDGLFNEILNGLLLSRHKASYPPAPTEFKSTGYDNQKQHCRNSESGDCRSSSSDLNGTFSGTSNKGDDREPLLSAPEPNAVSMPKFTTECGPQNTDVVIINDCLVINANQDRALSFPNNWFRLGIIPAGSTDSIVVSTTGVRDPVTSSLHIVLGKKISLDIAQVVRWKTSPSTKDLPTVRYAASFAGYGFYGDVIRESEKLRWMGPKRYDYAGTKVFLEHRSYEAEIGYFEPEVVNPVTERGSLESGMQSQQYGEHSNRVICRANCLVCSLTTNCAHFPDSKATTSANIYSDDSRWLRSKGRFLSIGAAVISCRNERAPDGLVADAHLADGFLHLILIRDCPRPLYLWHLIQLTKRGSKPLNFEFVEYHKTTAFTFSSSHDESIWNLDGELFQACQVSVQACRGLINLFAAGPEV